MMLQRRSLAPAVRLLFEVPKWHLKRTKALNQAVRFNIERFPEDFAFQLTKKEWDGLRSQTVTSNYDHQFKMSLK
jgi:hypothetical protein